MSVSILLFFSLLMNICLLSSTCSLLEVTVKAGADPICQWAKGWRHPEQVATSSQPVKTDNQSHSHQQEILQPINLAWLIGRRGEGEGGSRGTWREPTQMQIIF